MTLARLPGTLGVQVVAGSNPVAPTILKAADPEGLPSESAAFDFADPDARPAGAPFAEQLDEDFEANAWALDAQFACAEAAAR